MSVVHTTGAKGDDLAFRFYVERTAADVFRWHNNLATELAARALHVPYLLVAGGLARVRANAATLALGTLVAWSSHYASTELRRGRNHLQQIIKAGQHLLDFSQHAGRLLVFRF